MERDGAGRPPRLTPHRTPHTPCISRVSPVYLPCISRVSQVLEMEPAHLDTHAVVSGSTQVFPDGDALTEEDVHEEEVVGYEDVGGLEKQIGMARARSKCSRSKCSRSKCSRSKCSRSKCGRSK